MSARQKKYVGNLIAELSFASALPVYLAMIAHFYVFSLPTQHIKRCLIHGDMMFEHDWKTVYMLLMLLLGTSNFCYALFELIQKSNIWSIPKAENCRVF